MLAVISGPSGVGKDAVLGLLRSKAFPAAFITTMTTRAKRAGETDGVDYIFISKDKFQTLIERRELLEWANVYGNYYGVPKEPVRQALRAGRNAIVKVDVQGAASIKKIAPEAVFIFLLPSCFEELSARLEKRLTESPETLKRRLATAPEEIEQIGEFDYFVINREGELDRSVAEIEAIITAEKCRVKPRRIEI